MENTDIFIVTHCHVIPPVKNDSYKILSVSDRVVKYDVRDNTGDNISHLNEFYCELTGIYWVWKNWELKDYVGFCHYRRYFEFMSNVPDLSEMDCDVITIKPVSGAESMIEHYRKYHHTEDLDIAVNIAKEKFGVYDEQTLQQTTMLPCNMFVMSKEHFNEYCEFLFGVLDEYCKVKNIKSMADVHERVANDPGYNLKFASARYQARYAGFLAERLLNVWLAHKGLKIKTVGCRFIQSTPMISW